MDDGRPERRPPKTNCANVVAWALSQIFVVSDNVGKKPNHIEVWMAYYDMSTSLCAKPSARTHVMREVAYRWVTPAHAPTTDETAATPRIYQAACLRCQQPCSFTLPEVKAGSR